MNILVFWDLLRHFAGSTWLSFDVTGYSASLAGVGMLLVGRQVTWLLGQADLATLLLVLTSVDSP